MSPRGRICISCTTAQIPVWSSQTLGSSDQTGNVNHFFLVHSPLTGSHPVILNAAQEQSGARGLAQGHFKTKSSFSSLVVDCRE